MEVIRFLLQPPGTDESSRRTARAARESPAAAAASAFDPQGKYRVDPNFLNESGWSALHVAADKGASDAVH